MYLGPLAFQLARRQRLHPLPGRRQHQVQAHKGIARPGPGPVTQAPLDPRQHPLGRIALLLAPGRLQDGLHQLQRRVPVLHALQDPQLPLARGMAPALAIQARRQFQLPQPLHVAGDVVTQAVPATFTGGVLNRQGRQL